MHFIIPKSTHFLQANLLLASSANFLKKGLQSRQRQRQKNLYFDRIYVLGNIIRSSWIRGLDSTKCSSKRLQNFLYFMLKKNYICSFFSFPATLLFPLWIPWSMTTGALIRNKVKLHEMKNFNFIGDMIFNTIKLFLKSV